MKVVSNGEVKIEQYCGGDGYPSGRGYQIMLFVRDLYNSKRVKELKQYLGTTELVAITDEPCVFVNGAGCQADEAHWEGYATIVAYIREHSYTFASDFENIEDMLTAGLISESDAQYYMAMSSKTGNQVLDYILKHKPQKMKFFFDQNSEDSVESEYTINLDKQTVEYDWYGEEYVKRFRELSKMSDEQIYKMMKKIE